MHGTKTDVIDRERYDVLRRMLEERRREIQDKLRSIRETLPASDEVRDAEEQSVNDFVQDVDFALMEMKSETLARSTRRCSGWTQGTYGDLRRVRAGDRGGAAQGACPSRSCAWTARSAKRRWRRKSAPGRRLARWRPSV